MLKGRTINLLVALVVTSGLVVGGIWLASGKMQDKKVAAASPQQDHPRPPEHGSSQFPATLEKQPGVLHRSGGPYLTPGEVRQIVLDGVRCAIGGAQEPAPASAQSRCDRVDVRFYPRYEDAWKERGHAGGFVSGWGRDREIYVATLWGHVWFQPKGARQLNHDGVLTNFRTFQIDATTGQVMLSGGPPVDVSK